MKKIFTVAIIAFTLVSCYDVEKHLASRESPPNVTLDSTGLIRANGVDVYRVKLVFDYLPDTSLSGVTFKISDGAFVANNKTEITTKELRSDKIDKYFYFAEVRTSLIPGRYTITAIIPGLYERSIYARVSQSYPSSLKIDKDKFAVHRTFNDQIKLIAKVKGGTGLPSKNTPIEFVIADTLSSKNSNLFRSLSATDDSGEASVLFTPGSFNNYVGTVSFKAIWHGEKGLRDVIGIGTFEIIEPEK